MIRSVVSYTLIAIAIVGVCIAYPPSQPALSVGLAIEINNGVAIPLQVKKGQGFYLSQIDLRASTTSSVDEGVSGLGTRGDFAGLPWEGIVREEAEFLLLPNSDGTSASRRFFRGAAWMNARSTFRLEQVKSDGEVIGQSVVADIGLGDDTRPSDDYFTRRLRAIQWVRHCHTKCLGIDNFEEEALVEIRNATHPQQVFTIDPQTTALKLHWSMRPGRPYTIPLTQIESPPFSYGFSIDVDTETPARADGSYAPGSAVTFRITLKDGAGKRLHPRGSLPAYNEVAFGPNTGGIQYYRAFFDPTATYWRRKHRERMLMAEFIGPAQNARPIRSVIDLEAFLSEEDVQVTGTLARDGVYAEFHTFPTAHDLFGGASDPAHVRWAKPVPDTWTHHIPADAPSGTYYLNVKGRRVYLGEDIPFSKTHEIQVGSPQITQPVLTTGRCNTCHTGPSSLEKINHANAQMGTCAGCHIPLGFEHEGPIYVRTHFIHSRSPRFDVRLDRCSTCHLTRESIQRTSKSACMSCHKSYPESHSRKFGPIRSIYVGGGRESFQQCTSTCHQNHPNDNLPKTGTL